MRPTLTFYLLVFVSIISLGSCDKNVNTKKADLSEMNRSIQDVMDQQAADWNRGNIKAYMNGYWNSDSLMFIGGSGLTYGWQNTLDNYLRAYPDREAMGKLKFSELQFRPIDNENCFVVGKWYLTKNSKDRWGYFSLFWKRMPNGWKIIADHTGEES
ncbi:hypothetical protein FUAX_20410 [Fulvitalea axinellae]|uniref:DUF4440 domain-containing protein n=1 Tax=Fulvitalea axinellae TaxID=1182444 RepID=A0AAU9CT23_9BACT|nr:hypothetical protein FUAX_20410 [Fulvitalea axinellae]